MTGTHEQRSCSFSLYSVSSNLSYIELFIDLFSAPSQLESKLPQNNAHRIAQQMLVRCYWVAVICVAVKIPPYSHQAIILIYKWYFSLELENIHMLLKLNYKQFLVSNLKSVTHILRELSVEGPVTWGREIKYSVLVTQGDNELAWRWTAQTTWSWQGGAHPELWWRQWRWKVVWFGAAQARQ